MQLHWRGPCWGSWVSVIAASMNRTLRRRVQSGADKAACLTKLLRQQTAGCSQSSAGLAVFVGDSMSDLAPLLSADVGIVIGQNRILRRVAKAAGVRLKSLVCGAGAPLLYVVLPRPPCQRTLHPFPYCHIMFASATCLAIPLHDRGYIQRTDCLVCCCSPGRRQVRGRSAV